MRQVAPPVPRHAAATSAHEVVTTAEISGFRAKIHRGPRHHRRQKVPTWLLASLFIRTHHDCAQTAAKTYSQAQHHDHRLPRRQAKNTLKSNDLRGRATALGGLPRPSSVLPEPSTADEREPQRGGRRCQPLLPGRCHLSASLATPHVDRSGRAQRDGRASQHAADLRVGWRGARRALTAEEAAYARDCGRRASLPCRRPARPTAGEPVDGILGGLRRVRAG